LDASGTSGLAIDNLPVTQLFPAASTQTLGFFLGGRMIRCVFAISILLLSVVVLANGQQMPVREVSDADKAGIIESVLELELREQNHALNFTNTRQVSSENIEFIEPSRVAKRGFTLVSATQLSGWHMNQIVEYLVFRNIFLRDGVAVVALAHVREREGCFGGSFSQQRNYVYESRLTSEGWVAELTGRPAPSFFMKR